MATPTHTTPGSASAGPAKSDAPVKKEERPHDPAEEGSAPYDPAKAKPYVPAKVMTDEKAPPEHSNAGGNPPEHSEAGGKEKPKPHTTTYTG